MSRDRTRFAAPQRFMHWLMAMCVYAMLFIGIGMVSIVSPHYLLLMQIHKPLGITILVLAIIRLLMRFYYGAPALPADLPPLMKLGAILSHYALYAFMIGMPLIGWGMLSAASHPVILAPGIDLPPLLPVNPQTYSLLRLAHYTLALAFFATVLLHLAAALFHKFIRNDGVFETMWPDFGGPPSVAVAKTGAGRED